MRPCDSANTAQVGKAPDFRDQEKRRPACGGRRAGDAIPGGGARMAADTLHLHVSAEVSTPTCKLCGAAGPLVRRSHVIPRWMYELLPIDGRRFRIISAFEGEYEQRSQMGLYDSIVCSACEGCFQIWDDYAVKVLRQIPLATASGFDFGAYEYGKLARFYLSVLWRLHACSRPIANVDLGMAAAPLGRALLSDDDSSLSDYEIIPAWSRHILSFGVIGPRWVEYDATRYWKIYMPRFQVLINATSKPGSLRFAPWLMRAGNPLLMLEDTFESGEEEIVARTLQANMERKNASRC